MDNSKQHTKEDVKAALALIEHILFEEVYRDKLPNTWIPVTERLPESDDQLVVVKTKTGEKYFGRTINGKFMGNVVEWYTLPE